MNKKDNKGKKGKKGKNDRLEVSERAMEENKQANKDAIIEHLEKGLSIAGACTEAGVSKETWRRYMRDDPSFREAMRGVYKDEMSMARGAIANRLMWEEEEAAFGGGIGCAKWILQLFDERFRSAADENTKLNTEKIKMEMRYAEGVNASRGMKERYKAEAVERERLREQIRDSVTRMVWDERRTVVFVGRWLECEALAAVERARNITAKKLDGTYDAERDGCIQLSEKFPGEYFAVRDELIGDPESFKRGRSAWHDASSYIETADGHSRPAMTDAEKRVDVFARTGEVSEGRLGELAPGDPGTQDHQVSEVGMRTPSSVAPTPPAPPVVYGAPSAGVFRPGGMPPSLR